MSYPITSRIIFPLLRLFIKSVMGLENLPSKGPFIAAANHISQTDPLLIIATLFPTYQKKIRFLANRGNYGSIFEHLIASDWAGCILKDPNNQQLCIEQAVSWLRKGDIVGIFPEGERSPAAYNLKPGKTGLIRIALKAKVPILPIGVITQGEKHHIRNGELHSLGWDALWHYLVKGQRTRLNLGQPLSLEKYYDQPITYELLRQATDEVMREIARLSVKKYPY